MSKSIDYTSPKTQYSFDVNKSNLFKKDNQNLINVLGIDQLNTLDDVSILDIFLSMDNIIEPHYHQHAAELIYCVSGATTVSLLNPFTKKNQDYPLTQGQVANVPQGWWHYIVATANNTHFLGIFNSPTPEVILGSDILKLTPAHIMASTYCINEDEWKKTIAPVIPSTFIGPPKDCDMTTENTTYDESNDEDWYTEQMQPYTHQSLFNPQHLM